MNEAVYKFPDAEVRQRAVDLVEDVSTLKDVRALLESREASMYAGGRFKGCRRVRQAMQRLDQAINQIEGINGPVCRIRVRGGIDQ